MKSVVEWLYEALILDPITKEHFKYNERCWEKAKQLEVENNKKAYIDGGINTIKILRSE